MQYLYLTIYHLWTLVLLECCIYYHLFIFFHLFSFKVCCILKTDEKSILFIVFLIFIFKFWFLISVIGFTVSSIFPFFDAFYSSFFMDYVPLHKWTILLYQKYLFTSFYIRFLSNGTIFFSFFINLTWIRDIPVSFILELIDIHWIFSKPEIFHNNLLFFQNLLQFWSVF